MAPATVTLKFLGGLLATATLGASTILPQSIASRVLFKDVAIIGGGASGSHAAIRLKEDYGKSIVVIEAQSRLVCGHGVSVEMPYWILIVYFLGRPCVVVP